MARPSHYEAVAPVPVTRSNRATRVLAATAFVLFGVAVIALAAPGAGPTVLDSRVAKVRRASPCQLRLPAGARPGRVLP